MHIGVVGEGSCLVLWREIKVDFLQTVCNVCVVCSFGCTVGQGSLGGCPGALLQGMEEEAVSEHLGSHGIVPAREW